MTEKRGYWRLADWMGNPSRVFIFSPVNPRGTSTYTRFTLFWMKTGIGIRSPPQGKAPPLKSINRG